MSKKKIKLTRYFLRGNSKLLVRLAKILKYPIDEPIKAKDGYSSMGRRVRHLILHEVEDKRTAYHFYLEALALKKRIQVWCKCNDWLRQTSKKRILLNKK